VPHGLFLPAGSFNEWDVGQGDVFDTRLDLTASDLDYAAEGAVAIVVVDHECQVAKPSSKWVTCMPAFPFSKQDKGNQGNIRSGRVIGAMYLDRIPGLEVDEECYADLRFMSRVPKMLILKANNARVAAMTEEGREVLQEEVFQWVARHPHEGLVDHLKRRLTEFVKNRKKDWAALREGFGGTES
jgi:hypothetical protein